MALFLYRIWRKKRRTLFVLLLVASGSFAFNSGWRWTFGHDDDGFEKLLDQMVATELKNAERIRDCYEPGDEDANWRGHKPCEPLTDLPRGCPLPPDDLRRNLDVRPVTFCDSDGFEPPDKKDVGCTVPMNKTKRCEFADVRSWYVLRTSSGAAASVVKFGCPHQRFAGFSGESEAYYPNFLSGKERGEFNLSVDYRRSSDVPVTYYDPPAYDLRAVPLSYEQKRKKEAIATAFVSNCGSRNNREMWLSEMIKLIKVQSYGSCHHTAEVDKDVREKYASDSWRLKIQASRRFLFQLVFENSVRVADHFCDLYYRFGSLLLRSFRALGCPGTGCDGLRYGEALSSIGSRNSADLHGCQRRDLATHPEPDIDYLCRRF